MTSRHIPAIPKDLIECRKKTGITLAEISSATKISLRYLEAIERGDFRELPGGVYTLSYLHQYARATGFDEETLVAYYRDIFIIGEDPVFDCADDESSRLRGRLRSLLGAIGWEPSIPEAPARRL